MKKVFLISFLVVCLLSLCTDDYTNERAVLIDKQVVEHRFAHDRHFFIYQTKRGKESREVSEKSYVTYSVGDTVFINLVY